MGLFNKFPYTDLNSINLDYTLNKLNDLYERGEALYTQLQTWQAETTEDLASWKADVEAGLAEWKTATEGSLDTKFQQLTTAINTAFSDLETQLEAHIAEIETTAVNAASAASASATAAAGSASDAADSATAAAGSASDAEDTAESLSESLDQIATNASDITDLKSAKDLMTDAMVTSMGTTVNTTWERYGYNANVIATNNKRLMSTGTLTTQYITTDIKTLNIAISGNYWFSIQLWDAFVTPEDYSECTPIYNSPDWQKTDISFDLTPYPTAKTFTVVMRRSDNGTISTTAYVNLSISLKPKTIIMSGYRHTQATAVITQSISSAKERRSQELKSR